MKVELLQAVKTSRDKSAEFDLQEYKTKKQEIMNKMKVLTQELNKN